MAREYFSRFECAEPGCREHADFRSRTRAEQSRLSKTYGYGKWRCVRHSQPDEMLSMDNRQRVFEVASVQKEYGIFWGNFGFVHGPGFRAYSSDFPAGTILRVTAEIIPPTES